MSATDGAGERLHKVLVSLGDVAVAVSGGIDSLTLATAAHRALGNAATMHHATSPAVPPEATERTRLIAQRFGWHLDVFDAGEFDDPGYMANPVNRCFFCKTNLYGSIGARTDKQLLSGTNLDDLADYRPGLEAAKHHAVRHPFVETGIDKATVRRLARQLDLGELSDLPAAPCLSSRIETGIRIDPLLLASIHAVERHLNSRLVFRAVRCRVRAVGMVVEIDEATLSTMSPALKAQLRDEVRSLCGNNVQFEPYRTGSAFLRAAHEDGGVRP